MTCRNGHNAPRNKSGKCTECARKRQQRYRAKNAEAVSQRYKLSAYYEAKRQGGQELEEQRVIGRAEAMRLGLPSYFTGKPCKRGHIARRWLPNGTCFVCHAAARKVTYKKSASRRIAQAKEWANKNPNRTRAATRRYRSKNRKEIRVKAATQYAKNPQLFNDRAKLWRKSNPDKARLIRNAAKANRRAVLRKAGGKYTSKDITRLLQAQSNRCVYCKASLEGKERHVDHIMPLKLGGTNDVQNLQILCRVCNLKKRAQHPADFARRCFEVETTGGLDNAQTAGALIEG
jgi:5-methylcytosine-specific restriction endonuclease McrA